MSEKDLYEINTEEQYEFEVKHAKSKNFVATFIAVMIGCMVLFLRPSGRMANETESDFGGLLALGAVIALLAALYYMIISKNHTIEISGKTVKITIGRRKWTYPITSFVHAELDDNSFRQGYLVKCKLVFLSASGEEKVDLGAVDINNIDEISKIIFRLQDRYGGRLKRETAEPFDGDVYIGVHDQVNIGKVRKIVIGFAIAIVIMITSIVTSPNDPSQTDMFSYCAFIVISIFLAVTIVAFGIVMWRIFKPAERGKMLHLAFEDSGLKINGRSFPISDIEAVKMTAPEVIGNGYCYLEVFTKYDQKPERFIAGKMLESGMFEQERSAGCSCEYPSLYQAIKEFCISNEIKFN